MLENAESHERENHLLMQFSGILQLAFCLKRVIGTGTRDGARREMRQKENEKTEGETLEKGERKERQQGRDLHR